MSRVRVNIVINIMYKRGSCRPCGSHVEDEVTRPWACQESTAVGTTAMGSASESSAR